MIKGFLLHLTHYDPAWNLVKDTEKPFDSETAYTIIQEMAAAGMNTLIIDCGDAIEYQSHPELKRHYTRPMSALKALADKARKLKIEVIPKLNFSQSRFYQHNHWMYPHNEVVNRRDIFDLPEYWRIAFELIDELTSSAKPERFFHIGLDEDTDRAPSLFAAAANLLADGLKEKGLRTVMWRDIRIDTRGLVFSEKQDIVEDLIARDMILQVWNYEGVVNQKCVSRLIEKGHAVWIAVKKSEGLNQWLEVILSNNKLPGVILTPWLPCVKENLEKFRKDIADVGSKLI